MSDLTLVKPTYEKLSGVVSMVRSMTFLVLQGRCVTDQRSPFRSSFAYGGKESAGPGGGSHRTSSTVA